MPTYLRIWKVHGSIIRQRGDSFQVETNHNGKRERETFTSEQEAERHAKQRKTEVKAEGAKAFSIKGGQRIEAVELLDAFPSKMARNDALEAVRLLTDQGRGYDLDKPLLTEAVRFWMLHHPQGGTLPSLKDALDAYLESKAGRRPATLYEIGHKAGRFVKAFPDKSVSDITAGHISEWLDGNLETVGTKRQYLTVISGLFSYATQKHGLPDNPAKGVVLNVGTADQSEVQAYTVDEVRRIMAAASASVHASRIVPTIAIGFFAGLRPAEVQGLDWADVSLPSMRVRVSPQTAKKRRARYVDMSDNLVEWLAPYAQASGPVAPPLMTYRRARAEIMKVVKCSLIKDGFRHSFGTYHLAAFENAAKTALLMGHRADTDLVFTNYRKLVTREEGQAFWQIKPPRLIEQTSSCPE